MLARTVAGKCIRNGVCVGRDVIARRYISSNEMFEVFGNSTKKGTGDKAIEGVATSKPIDPVINIGSSSSSSSNSGKGIADTFSRSLNDFTSVPQDQQMMSTNWSESFHGLGNEPFSPESQDILYHELPDDDIEITPDGLLYLPEIKYRRILNKAFGAGAWGLAPRSETLINDGLLTREYGLVIHGRLVSIARGEQTFFKESGIPTATEGCKSNALMRCCKDLGIASELWDPRFIKKFKKKNCESVFVEYIPTKKKKKIWKRKDEDVEYPFKR